MKTADNNKMNKDNQQPSIIRLYRAVAGVALIGIGMLIFLDQYLNTGWLVFLPMPVVGLLALYGGVRFNKLLLMMLGSLLLGLGAGLFMMLNRVVDIPLVIRLGALLVTFGFAWIGIFFLSSKIGSQRAWWSLMVGSLIVSTGAVFLFTPLRLLDFVLYVTIGLVIPLLAWGAAEKLIGLLIPGCILMGAGPGVYLAWGVDSDQNALVRTGVMLVLFALGWGLITLSSRFITEKFIWWPLIPGGILAVVGWGLYIGGNPGNAASIIGNTTSIGIIIIGFYLLLMRRGIRKE